MNDGIREQICACVLAELSARQGGFSEGISARIMYDAMNLDETKVIADQEFSNWCIIDYANEIIEYHLAGTESPNWLVFTNPFEACVEEEESDNDNKTAHHPRRTRRTYRPA